MFHGFGDATFAACVVNSFLWKTCNLAAVSQTGCEFLIRVACGNGDLPIGRTPVVSHPIQWLRRRLELHVRIKCLCLNLANPGTSVLEKHLLE